MAPGSVLNIVLDIGSGLHIGTGQTLGEWNGLVAEGSASNLDRFGDGVQISGIVSGAGVKLLEKVSKFSRAMPQLRFERLT